MLICVRKVDICFFVFPFQDAYTLCFNLLIPFLTQRAALRPFRYSFA